VHDPFKQELEELEPELKAVEYGKTHSLIQKL